MPLPDPLVLRQIARQVVGDMTGSVVGDGDPLISSGLIDSLALLRFIGRLEHALGITIPLEAVQPDDFDSVDAIIETVTRVHRS